MEMTPNDAIVILLCGLGLSAVLILILLSLFRGPVKDRPQPSLPYIDRSEQLRKLVNELRRASVGPVYIWRDDGVTIYFLRKSSIGSDLAVARQVFAGTLTFIQVELFGLADCDALVQYVSYKTDRLAFTQPAWNRLSELSRHDLGSWRAYASRDRLDELVAEIRRTAPLNK